VVVKSCSVDEGTLMPSKLPKPKHDFPVFDEEECHNPAESVKDLVLFLVITYSFKMRLTSQQPILLSSLILVPVRLIKVDANWSRHPRKKNRLSNSHPPPIWDITEICTDSFITVTSILKWRKLTKETDWSWLPTILMGRLYMWKLYALSLGASKTVSKNWWN